MCGLIRRYSAWWGQSFVSELTRISEQAEKKLNMRRGSLLDSAPSNSEDGANKLEPARAGS